MCSIRSMITIIHIGTDVGLGALLAHAGVGTAITKKRAIVFVFYFERTPRSVCNDSQTRI